MISKEEIRRRAEIMLAYCNGEIIEEKSRRYTVWNVKDNPSSDFDFENYSYRIKPKIVHKVGNRYKNIITNREYILANICDHGCRLICLKSGWDFPSNIKVKNTNNITKEEFNIITALAPEHFIKIEN